MRWNILTRSLLDTGPNWFPWAIGHLYTVATFLVSLRGRYTQVLLYLYNIRKVMCVIYDLDLDFIHLFKFKTHVLLLQVQEMNFKPDGVGVIEGADPVDMPIFRECWDTCLRLSNYERRLKEVNDFNKCVKHTFLLKSAFFSKIDNSVNL